MFRRKGDRKKDIRNVQEKELQTERRENVQGKEVQTTRHKKMKTSFYGKTQTGKENKA